MKNLLTITALLEFSTGLILVIAPSNLTVVLLGVTLDTAASLILARLAGIALMSLGIICWTARNNNASASTRGLLLALMIYNAGAAAVLLYAGIGVGLLGIGLWPVVLVHLAMAAGCIFYRMNRQAA